MRGVVAGAMTIFGAQVAGYAMGIVASVIIARALGPEGRGLYYIPVAAAVACVGLGHLSIEVSNTYFFAQGRYSLQRLARNTSTVLLVMGPIVVLAMVAFFAATRNSVFHGVSTANYLLVVFTVPFTLQTTWIGSIFLLGRRVAQWQLALLAGAALQAAGAVILFAAHDLDVHTVLVLYAASVMLPWALLVFWARSFAPPRPTLDMPMAREVVGFGLRLHVGFIFWFLLLRVDIFLVAAILGTKAVGLYSLAVLFGELVWLLTNPLVAAALPFQSSMTVQEASPLTFKVVRFNVAVALVLAAAFAAALPLVIPLLYGKSFSPAYPAILALLPGIVAMAGARPLFNWLIRHGRPGVLGAISVGAFLVNLALNLLLLRPLGIVAAGVASSVAYIGLTAAFLIWGTRLAGLSARAALIPQRGDIETLQRLVTRFRTIARALLGGVPASPSASELGEHGVSQEPAAGEDTTGGPCGIAPVAEDELAAGAPDPTANGDAEEGLE